MLRGGGWWIAIAAALPLTGASPRPPDSAEQRADLVAIAAYALNYAKGLPDFSCRLESKQYVVGRPDNPATDVGGVIEEMFAFAGNEESYQVIQINNKLAADSHHPTFDPLPWKQFGTVLKGIFDPHTGTNFHWDRWVQRQKRWLWVFDFSVARSNGYPVVESKGTLVVGYKGLVFADPQTKAVMRIELESVDIPSDSEYRRIKLALDYQPMHLGGRDWILPAHYLQSLSEEQADITKEGSYQGCSARPSILLRP